MGRIPSQLKKIIASNIRACRKKRFPRHGGSKQCAAQLGVSPQQWTLWEVGKRTPDEVRMAGIADFFGVTVEDLRRDNLPEPTEENRLLPEKAPSATTRDWEELFKQSARLLLRIAKIQQDVSQGKLPPGAALKTLRKLSGRVNLTTMR